MQGPVQAAATGDAFLASARTVGELLVRNGMKSVTVWWLPQFVLQWTVLGAAGLLGAVTYGVSFGLGNGSSRHSPGAVRPKPFWIPVEIVSELCACMVVAFHEQALRAHVCKHRHSHRTSECDLEAARSFDCTKISSTSV